MPNRIASRPAPKPTRPASPNIETRSPRPPKKADGFEQPRASKVNLQPLETSEQQRGRKVGELNSLLNRVMTSNPPMGEAEISKVLGNADDGKYNLNAPQLNQQDHDGVVALTRGIHQIARARIALAENQPDVAKALLDLDGDQQYGGAITYRDIASRNLAPGESTALAKAIIDLSTSSFGAVSPDQITRNADANQSLSKSAEITGYFESKNRTMSQGTGIQNILMKLVEYQGDLKNALAMPLTDGNRVAAVQQAKTRVDALIESLGGDQAVTRLEAGRRGTIDGLNNTGDLIGAVPTLPTRVLGASLKTAANGLEYSAGDITGKQLAWKEAGTIIDVVGGQLTSKLGTVAKLAADGGAEFAKTLAGELSKIDPRASESEQRRQLDLAVRTALFNTVTGVYTDAIGNSLGETGKSMIRDLAKSAVSALAGGLSAKAWEMHKALFDPALSAEDKAKTFTDSQWKGVTNGVKSAFEALIERSK